eukprot:TRINITY_DN730_c0_g1_i1.p1 TRINITY_DN730_c0_g1~~TRINITY_DN730_c0_g1_i1.p1  ORF type:complete len:509 (-),score=126.21 TRINITY_DN730_c0_g1_i1:76-1602(-)
MSSYINIIEELDQVLELAKYVETLQKKDPQQQKNVPQQQKTEPQKTEPQKIETQKTEPPKTESQKTEPPKTESQKTEPPKTEPPKTESQKTEPPKTESQKTEPPKTESQKTEPPKTETQKTEPSKTEPQKTEPQKKKKKAKKPRSLVEDCKKLLAEKKWPQALKKIFEHQKIVWNKGETKDILGFFCMWATLSSDKVGVSPDLLKETIRAITDNPKQHTSIRLTLLNYIYNLHADQESRFSILQAILKFILKTNETDSIVDEIESIEDRIKNWPLEHQREILKSVCLVLEKTDGTTETYRKLISKYFGTFEKPNSQDLHVVKDDVKRMILNCVKSFYQLDNLLNYPVVLGLKDLPSPYAQTFELLDIFATKRVDAFISFNTRYPDFLSSEGLNHQDLMKKIQLLTLVSLASVSSTVNNVQQISYSDIVNSLKIDESTVEIWVINAISESLIDAKIDQKNRVVLVQRSLHRAFTPQHWVSMKSKLSQWRKNLQTVIQVIEKAKEEKPKS